MTAKLNQAKRERRQDLVTACAIAHGRGVGLSIAALIELVLEDGLPSRAERERILAERMRDDIAESDAPTAERLDQSVPDVDSR